MSQFDSDITIQFGMRRWRFQRFTGLFHGVDITEEGGGSKVRLSFSDSDDARGFRDLIDEVANALDESHVTLEQWSETFPAIAAPLR